MQILRPEDTVPIGCCLTLGNFDGVHLGHQLIIARLKTRATRLGTPAGLATFEPSPQLVLHQEFPFILTPFAEKCARLEQLGLDFLYVLEFGPRVRETQARDFFEQTIIQRFRPRAIVIGHDHRFGFARSGDAALLAELEAAWGFELDVLPECQVNGSAVKSTRIRERLILGDVRSAAELLGYRYELTGSVVRGQGLGVRLGFPTINIAPSAPEKLIPASGVYAVLVTVLGRIWFGAANIGFRPSLRTPEYCLGPETGPTIEVHILDFDQPVYGASVQIEFVERLRPERSFASLEALRAQIAADVALSRLVLTGQTGCGPSHSAFSG